MIRYALLRTVVKMHSVFDGIWYRFAWKIATNYLNGHMLYTCSDATLMTFIIKIINHDTGLIGTKPNGLMI